MRSDMLYHRKKDQVFILHRQWGQVDL
jgi:hypothetical protein